MDNIILSVDSVSKRYQLGTFSAGTFGGDIQRWWCKVRGKEDPFAKVGANDRSKKTDADFVMALQNIDFEVKRGEVLGIIGKNGAGKSTLLKILSRVTSPTGGVVRSKGRIASLLEVGTGFHPELTGKENIFLNGAVLGMTKVEIKRKLDEIIEFSGCAQYIDTPVKRYSSGMVVRLGFAVAAFLDPEILIVDEVLAVGDFEFQRKAIGKMKDCASGEGKTVLFVSHNMDSIKKLCTTGMVIENGKQVFSGSARDAVNFYTNKQAEELTLETNKSWGLDDAPGNEFIKIKSARAVPVSGKLLTLDSGITIEVEFINHKQNTNLDITIELLNIKDQLIIHQGCQLSESNDSKKGAYKTKFTIQSNTLNSGQYKLNVMFGENRRYLLFKHEAILSFEIELEGGGNTGRQLPGILHLDMNPTFEYLG